MPNRTEAEKHARFYSAFRRRADVDDRSVAGQFDVAESGYRGSGFRAFDDDLPFPVDHAGAGGRVEFLIGNARRYVNSEIDRRDVDRPSGRLG